MIKINVFIEFFVLMCICIAHVWSDCTISMEAADKCGMKSMIFGNRDMSAPTNDAELDEFCVQVRKNGKCVSDFNDRCLKGNIQMAIKIALKNGERFIDKRCNVGKDRNEFLSHIKCLSPKEKMEPFHLCADKHLVMLTKLKEIPKGERIASLCCITHVSQDCLRQKFKSVCGEDTASYWDDSWNELVEENMQFACSNFDNLAKCESGMDAGVWKIIKDVAATDDATALAARHKFKSEITTAVELMDLFE